MRIGIDLDSVLADLMIPLNSFQNDRYGTAFLVDDYVDYSLSSLWGTTNEETIQRVYDFYNSPLMDTIPLVPGAKEGIDYLAQNHDLMVITSRPDSTKASTLGWIELHFPHTFSDIILTNQFSKEKVFAKTKGEIGSALNISVMIDDFIEYAEDCASHGIQTFLFEAPWNKNKPVSSTITRMRNWSEIQSLI